MQTHPSLRLFCIFCLVCICAISCSAPAATTPANPDPIPTSPESATRGPGPFDLVDPSALNRSLGSYQSSLRISFDGQIAGATQSWNAVYTFLASPERDVRLLLISQSGLPQDSSLDGWVIGKLDGLVYHRLGEDAPCGAVFLTADNEPASLEPAQMLPPVAGAEVLKTDETLDGIPVTHYRFDERAVDMAGLGSAQGELWIANNGGYIVQYTLRIQSDQGIYDPDQTGTMTWEYALKNVNQPLQFSLPADCPAGMDGLPLPADAGMVEKLPGYQVFTTGLSVPDAAAYFQQNLPAAGFQEDSPAFITDQQAYLEYSDGSRSLTILAAAGSQTTIRLGMAWGTVPLTEVPIPTPEPTQAAYLDNTRRISQSLMLVLGDDDTPSVYPSYHLELAQTLPVFDPASGAIQASSIQMSADIQGSDVHLVYQEPGSGQQTPQVTEGYLIGETNYLVTNGQVQEDIFGIQMIWISWPLDMVVPMGMAGLYSESQGSQAVDGRPADKFLLDSAKADPASLEMLKGMMGSFGQQILEARGTIWLDQQTNGLLKLELNYTANVQDTDGKVVGTGAGRIEITISQVGQVAVQLP